MSRRRARAASLPVKPKPRRTEDAAVGFHHHHVARQLGEVPIAIAEAAAAAVLLVGPQHDADRPARPQIQLLHQAQRLPRHHAAAAIVGRSGADVPGVEVAADDDDFVRQLAAAELADHVGRVGVGQEVRLHRRASGARRAAIAHALQPRGILGRHRGGGNLRLPVGVGAARRCAACEGRRDRPRE